MAHPTSQALRACARVRARRLVIVGLLLLWAPAIAVAQDEDPNLKQKIDAAQQVVTAKKVLSTGHVDVGPHFVDGRWTLMIHDDSAKADGVPSAWRHTEHTALQVSDDALLKAPDDPDYAFLHVKAGAPVYVVPQTQDPDVVWVGWNTQDPEVMDTIDRGATMTLTDVQGPGNLVVYLQSGSFAAPKVLWDSTTDPQPVWLDVNTHTHANWVFTKPGVYLVQIEITADLIDGSKVTDTRALRFAVGADTSADRALAATWRGAVGTGEGPTAAPAPQAGQVAGASDDSGPWLVVAIIVSAAALVGGLVLAVVRGNRAKHQARAASARAQPVDADREAGKA